MYLSFLRIFYKGRNMMKKQVKRFIALFVVIMSIISFLPVGYNGQAANAATGTGTDLEVKVIGESSPLSPVRDDTYRENIYTTKTVVDGFDLTVEDLRKTIEEMSTEAKTKKTNITGYIDQKVNILKINSMDATTVGTNGELDITNNIGIKIEDSQNVPGATPRTGKRLKNLPLGVNLIQYNLTLTQVTVTYVPATDTEEEKVIVGEAKSTTYDSQSITIEHATKYVVNKINPMTINSYIGNAADIDDESLKDNNTIPFLYSRVATPDSNMALRYIIDVPDSYTSLNYEMTFDKTLVLDNAKVYKKGQLDTNVTTQGNKLSGNLLELGDRDIIVVKLDATEGNSSIQKAYSVELRYTNLDSDKDYSLKEAGITKLDYNNDSTVKAYIGKRFNVTKTTDGVPQYEGDIYIDEKARMISLDPILYRSKDTVAYELNNDYVSDGNSGNKKSEFKNGKQYVNFMYGTTSNKLNLNVYEGKDGNISGSHLATYVFNVHLIQTDKFKLDIRFSNAGTSTEDAYLTQRGVKDNKIDFKTTRRVYDLYSSNPVNVIFTGTRSSKNEYLRVWLSDSEGSGIFKEAQESIDNVMVDGKRETSITVDLGKAKKMKVQAYYDELDASGDLIETHAIDNAYEFYLPENNSGSTIVPGENSEESALRALKVKEGTLKDNDGVKGFSSDKYEYTVTVPKDSKTAHVTATAEDDNVKSIVANVKENSASYEFTSGVASEVDLNPSGKTTLNITVTAQNGESTSTYTVVILNDTKGSDATLENIIVNPGEYTFDPDEEKTQVRVNEDTTSVKITPVPTDPKAKVTVDGKKFNGSPLSVSLKGNYNTEVEIKVTSEDGLNTEKYIVTIKRSDVEIEDPEEPDYSGSAYYNKDLDLWIDKTKYEEWGTVKGKPVYFDKKGRQVKDAWISDNGNWYYVNDRGFRATGWKMQTDGNYYYLDNSTGVMRTGWIYVGDMWYYMGTNGIMKTGWLEQNKKWYYLAPSGQMIANQSMYINGKVYNFAQDGTMY